MSAENNVLEKLDWVKALDACLESILILDMHGQILFANSNACNLYGYGADELVSMNFAGLDDSDAGKILPQSFRRALDSVVQYQTVHSAKSKAVMNVDVTMQNVSLSEPQLIMATVRRVPAEESLKALDMEWRYRALFLNTNQGIGYHRVVMHEGRAVDYIFLDRNPAADKQSGLKDVVGKRLKEVLPDIDETNPHLLESYGRVLNSGESETFTDYYAALGKWFTSTLYPLKDNIVAAIFEDVTDFLKVRQDLQDSELKFKKMFERMQSGIVVFEVVVDQNGEPEDLLILDGNPIFEETTGLDMSEARGRKLTDALPGIEKDAASWIKRYGKVALTGQPIQIDEYSELLDRVYTISAYQLESNKCAVNFLDVTKIRKLELEKLESSRKEIRALTSVVSSISTALEYRDPYTAGHEKRVAKLCVAIATELNLSEQMINGLWLGALIHDVGKIAVPAELLSKPSVLTDVEFALIKQHAEAGYNIVKDIDFPWPIGRMILQHHERLDGSGYPSGLSGDDLILEARILSVADVVEAMSSHRPYRPALGIEFAISEIKAKKGVLYDQNVVDACLKVLLVDNFSFDERLV